MYKVLRTFIDLQDGKHLYQKGDEYPRKGYSSSNDRVKELSTEKNKAGEPLIEVVRQVVEQVVQEQKVEQPKRKRGKKVDDNRTLSGVE